LGKIKDALEVTSILESWARKKKQLFLAEL